MKLGCTVVSGYTPELSLVSGRLEAVNRGVALFEKNFNRGQMIAGPLYCKKPPRLPDNVAVIAETQCPIKTGLLVAFHDVGLKRGNIDFVPGARIAGKLDIIKEFLTRRKFRILSRYREYVCLELML